MRCLMQLCHEYKIHAPNLKRFLKSIAVRDKLRLDGAKEEWITINGTPVLLIDGVPQGKIATKLNFQGDFPNKSARSHLRKRQAQGHYTNLTVEQYKQRAADLMQSEIGGNIDGYQTDGGKVVRWNKTTGDYATGYLDGTIKTMFPLDGGERRFNSLMERDRKEFGGIYG